MSAPIEIAEIAEQSKSPKLRAPDERMKLFQFALYDNLVNEFAASNPEASAKIRDIMMFYVNMSVDDYQLYAQNMTSKNTLSTLRKEMKNSTKPPKPAKKVRAKKEKDEQTEEKPKRAYKKRQPVPDTKEDTVAPAVVEAPVVVEEPVVTEQPVQKEKPVSKKRQPNAEDDTKKKERKDKKTEDETSTAKPTTTTKKKVIKATPTDTTVLPQEVVA